MPAVLVSLVYLLARRLVETAGAACADRREQGDACNARVPGGEHLVTHADPRSESGSLPGCLDLAPQRPVLLKLNGVKALEQGDYICIQRRGRLHVRLHQSFEADHGLLSVEHRLLSTAI